MIISEEEIYKWLDQAIQDNQEAADDADDTYGPHREYWLGRQVAYRGIKKLLMEGYFNEEEE